MALRMALLVLFLSLIAAQLSCPAYECKPESLDMTRDTCIYYQANTYYLQVCDFGYYCEVASGTENSTCQMPPQPINPPVVNWVGEFCNYMIFCRYGNCYNGLCRGVSLDEPCQSNADCDIGLFCTNGICEIQIEEGEKGCVYDTDCVNSAGCNQGTCVGYFSLEAGSPVSSCFGNVNLLCESAHCLQQSSASFTCLPSIQSQGQLPVSCESNQDCASAPTKYGTITSNCTCGKNPQGTAFCSPFFGDSPGEGYLSVLKSWTHSDLILSCNTDRRFEYTCLQSHMDLATMREFWYYEALATLYAEIQNTANCTWFVYYVGVQEIQEEFQSQGHWLALGLLYTALNA